VPLPIARKIVAVDDLIAACLAALTQQSNARTRMLEALQKAGIKRKEITHEQETV
jgi:hypothetical protein